jgi:hypothetical protein
MMAPLFVLRMYPKIGLGFDKLIRNRLISSAWERWLQTVLVAL